MHFAAMQGQLGAMKCLKDLRADIEAKINTGGTPMHYAAIGGHIKIMSWPYEQKPEMVNIRANGGRTPLSLAIECGHTEAVQWLKKHGAII